MIVNNVTPGLCYSSLLRNVPFPHSVLYWLMQFFLARTSEEGARQIVWAALVGETDGGNADLRQRAHGAYVSDCSIAEESDWVLSKDGQECERRVWVSGFHLRYPRAVANADIRVSSRMRLYRYWRR